MAHPYLHFGNSQKEIAARERLDLLLDRVKESHYRAHLPTLNAVGQLGRYNQSLSSPWKRLLNNPRQSIQELTLEFLATFSFNPPRIDAWKKCIRFRVARTWCKCTIAEFGEYLDLYNDDTADWAVAS